MFKKQSIAIIGAGIVGLSHAWSAAKRGHCVTVFERDSEAFGASIRNFGMVWPIGLPPGKLHQIALNSRRLWLELKDKANLWVNPCGSVHLAYESDEWEVLQEFAAIAPKLGYECSLLDYSEVIKMSNRVNSTNLRGGLWSPSELCIDSPNAIKVIPKWLEKTFNVKFVFSSPVKNIAYPKLTLSDNTDHFFDQFLVCSGHDLLNLFPSVYKSSGIKQCKLQMLKIDPQQNNFNLGPHLASGLTIRHYRNFQICDSQKKVKERFASTNPEYDKFGIHIMAAQNKAGEIITGDSHDYETPFDPFSLEEIDNLILKELKKIVNLPSSQIKSRWIGIYAKHPDLVQFVNHPEEGVALINSTSGLGMTLSFGLAEAYWQGEIITSYDGKSK